MAAGWVCQRKRPFALVAVATHLVEMMNRLHNSPQGWRLHYALQSDVGQERDLDEDSLLAITLANLFEGNRETTLGLFAVADGMGGYEGGEFASRYALHLLGRSILDRVFQRILSTKNAIDEAWMTNALVSAIKTVNKGVYAEQQKRGNEMGTTMTAALILNETAVIANIGDSRTYLWRDSTLQQITQDHSLVASLIAAGELEADALYTHEQKNVIYRSLGDRPDVRVDTFTVPLQDGDRLVFCCDGVWEMIRPEGIAAVMLSEPDPQQACDEMVKRANLAGGEDNISVIVTAVEYV